MAITALSLTQAIDAIFEGIRPQVDLLTRLGVTDFSDEAPNDQWMPAKPGATLKVLVDQDDLADEYDDETNNYFTGSTTGNATMICKHFLKGKDFTGRDIDSGAVSSVAKIEQRFSRSVSRTIQRTIVSATRKVLDTVTQSTAVKIPVTGTATLKDYRSLGGAIEWLPKEDCVLCVNPTEYDRIRDLLDAKHFTGNSQQAGQELDFRDLIRIPGMTARAVILPYGALRALSRVPAGAAEYLYEKIETDPKTRLSIAIRVANDQTHNRRIVNGDGWFGAAVVSANATATTPGAIKIGTAG